jgi:hypothetical protein
VPNHVHVYNFMTPNEHQIVTLTMVWDDGSNKHGWGALGGDSRTQRCADLQCTPIKSSLPVVTAGKRAEVVGIRRRRERKIPLSACKGKSLMWAGFFFLGSRGILGHFFGFFPFVDVVTPKIPGGVIIKGPLTARKKKKLRPRPWFRLFLGFPANWGSRAVPNTGIW